ncbi:MlaC/ttg2D family ABC transporter substrate-binding protein [Algicella marina]|nr:ABC transporter substrate-binding protein [Algicella marina]
MPLNENQISRRSVMAGIAAAGGLAVVPHGAAAATTDQAIGLVNKIVAELLQVVKSSQSTAQALSRFEQIFVTYGDVPVIARSVLGPAWRQTSGAQQSAFISAFRGYLARKYGKQFREFRDATVEVTRAVDRGDKGIVVSSVLKYSGSAPIAVDWQVSDRSGSLKMFNLFIEGVSMLSTERNEVGALLEANRNSVDALIADLNQRG